MRNTISSGVRRLEELDQHQRQEGPSPGSDAGRGVMAAGGRTVPPGKAPVDEAGTQPYSMAETVVRSGKLAT